MKKTGIILLVSSIFIILIGVISIPFSMRKSERPKKQIVTGMPEFKKKLEKKENMLIYVTEDNCDLCKPIDKMIHYYENAYGLEFYYSNRENLTSGELKEYFELEDQAIELPAVVYIRDGLLKGIDNKILSEDYFRDYLMDYGFIDKSYTENDYRISYEEFKEKYSSSEKQILYFYNYGSNVYSLGETGEKKEYKNIDTTREELFKLSKENNFKYRIVFYNSKDSDKIYQEIITNIGKKEISGPFIVITENSKVLDYVLLNKKASVTDFLKKNGFIN